eukprot:bmy_20600T0
MPEKWAKTRVRHFQGPVYIRKEFSSVCYPKLKMSRILTGSLEDHLEGLPQPLCLKAPNEEVNSRVSRAVGAGQVDADVAESVMFRVSYEAADDAEGQPEEKEAQDRQQKNQVELSGPVLLGARLDSEEEQQAGQAQDGEREEDPHGGGGRQCGTELCPWDE